MGGIHAGADQGADAGADEVDAPLGRPCLEAVRLVTAEHPGEHDGVLVEIRDDGSAKLVVSRELAPGAMCTLLRDCGVSGNAADYVVESCRTGERSGESRLGHHLAVLRPLQAGA